MDLSLESALNGGESAGEPTGYLDGRPLEEWNAAYTRVESYLLALRVRNRELLGQLVIQVLQRARRRAAREPQRPPIELAAEELDSVVTDWFAQVLQESPGSTDHLLTTRGRLALLMADMPGKWQDQFLHPGPWPEAFTSAMREAYLRAGPDFQRSKMPPRPLDLATITTLTSLSRTPWLRIVFIWALVALALILYFVRTH